MRDTDRVALAGILVGGAASRMQGQPKGLLLAPTGETLIQKWQSAFTALGIPAVLVGRHDAYADVPLPQIDDDPPGIGPLGGLIALLSRAGAKSAIAVACDMPFVSVELLRRLATFGSTAAAVAPRHANGTWEPLFARYDAPSACPTARTRVALGQHSLQGLLDELGAEALPLVPSEWAQLRDWDTPRDVGSREPRSAR